MLATMWHVVPFVEVVVEPSSFHQLFEYAPKSQVRLPPFQLLLWQPCPLVVVLVLPLVSVFILPLLIFVILSAFPLFLVVF